MGSMNCCCRSVGDDRSCCFKSGGVENSRNLNTFQLLEEISPKGSPSIEEDLMRRRFDSYDHASPTGQQYVHEHELGSSSEFHKAGVRKAPRYNACLHNAGVTTGDSYHSMDTTADSPSSYVRFSDEEE